MIRKIMQPGIAKDPKTGVPAMDLENLCASEVHTQDLREQHLALTSIICDATFADVAVCHGANPGAEGNSVCMIP